MVTNVAVSTRAEEGVTGTTVDYYGQPDNLVGGLRNTQYGLDISSSPSSYESRGILEVDVTGLAGDVAGATLRPNLLDGYTSLPNTMQIWAYAGDGQLSMADHAAGLVQVGSATITDADTTDPSYTLTLDASGINQVIAQGTGWLGLNFRLDDAALTSSSFEGIAILPVGTTLDVVAVAPNRAPVVVPDESTMEEDAPGIIMPAIYNDYDPDGDPLSFNGLGPVTVASSNLQVASLDLSSKVTAEYAGLQLVPDGAFDPLRAGEMAQVSVTYSIKDDSGAVGTGNWTVTVTGTNDAPAAAADTALIDEDAPQQDWYSASGNVLANDTDIEGDALRATRINGTDQTPVTGAYGSLSWSDSGQWYYTLDNANGTLNGLAVGQALNETFGYTVSDGQGGTAQQTLTITIRGANDAPTAVSDGYTTAKGQTLTVAAAQGVLANDSDVDIGDTRTASVVATTANGRLTLNADGSFAYTPNQSFQGADTFSYVAKDAALATSNSATVTILVSGGGGSSGGGSTTEIRMPDGQTNYTGTSANETIYGNALDNTIIGGGGNDVIFGGDGADRLNGTEGDDRLTGGPGGDCFVGWGKVMGKDVVTDFDLAVGDFVEVSRKLSGVDTFEALKPLIYDYNGMAVLQTGSSSGLAFQGVLSAQFTADDFVFV